MKYQKLVYFFIVFGYMTNLSSDTTSHISRRTAFSKLLKDCSPEELEQRVQHIVSNRISKEIEKEKIPFSNVSNKLSQMFNFPLFKNLTSVVVYGVIFEKHSIKHETIWFQRPSKPDQMTPEDKENSERLANKIDYYMAIPRLSGQRRERK